MPTGKQLRPSNEPCSEKSPGLLTRPSKNSIGLFLFLLLAPAVLSLTGHVLVARYPDLLSAWGVYLDMFYIFALAAWARLSVTTFASSWLRSLPRWVPTVLFLLYGEASYLVFLITIVGEPWPLRALLLFLALTQMVFVALKPSYSVILLTAVASACVFVDGAADCYLRVHFDEIPFTIFNLVANLGFSFYSLGVTIAAILVLTRNPLHCQSRNRSLRDAAGLALLMVIYLYAHLYGNAAMFTNGETFSYTDKAISLQWKRNMAQYFPNLPQRVYSNL